MTVVVVVPVRRRGWWRRWMQKRVVLHAAGGRHEVVAETNPHDVGWIQDLTAETLMRMTTEPTRSLTASLTFRLMVYTGNPPKERARDTTRSSGAQVVSGAHRR